MTEVTAAPRAAPPTQQQIESHRRELTAYCYRMLGSPFEAEDAVQETMVRAWRNLDRFEGRSSLRTWLYSIATNVCIDMSRGRQRRAQPMDLAPASTVAQAQLVTRPESAWLEPIPDGQVLPGGDDPGEVVAGRDSIRLAFVAALQRLPARQRAVLILCEVLRWKASEAAQLLDTTVASVNSALQRARATLAAAPVTDADVTDPDDPGQRELLARFVDAFERYDMDALVALLAEDAVQSMPPFDLWIQGATEIRDWMLGPGAECRGSRLLATTANGHPAFGQYRPSGPGGRHEPWALHVLELRDGSIVGLHSFVSPDRLFPLFGLPPHPDDATGG